MKATQRGLKIINYSFKTFFQQRDIKIYPVTKFFII